jgi:L-iditol 2-dehydrogenase
VLEAVGIQPTINTALSITRKGGALTLIGNVSPRVEMGLQEIVSREITIYGVCATNEYPACVELVAAGRINVDPLISETARLEDGQAVFDRLYHDPESSIRTVFVFD